jgi:hypothetical protein
MGGECSTHRRNEYRNLVRKLEVKCYLEDLGVDEKIISQCIIGWEVLDWIHPAQNTN